MICQRIGLTIGLALACAGLADAWELDYGKALRSSRQDGKPVLVIIGLGKEGWRQLLKEDWKDDLLRTIREKFHAVYVDAEDTEYGKAVSDMFNFQQLPALVISDRFGRTQAVRHQGQLTQAQLRQLVQQHGVETSVARGALPAPGNGEHAGYVPAQQARSVWCPT